MDNHSICPKCHLSITLPESCRLDYLSHKMKIKATFHWGEKLYMTPSLICPGLQNPEIKVLQNSVKHCSVARKNLTDPQNFRASKELFRKLLASQSASEAVSHAHSVASCQHLLPNCHYAKATLYPHGMGMGRQVLSLVDGHEREGVTPFPHRWCSWGNPEHFPESAEFSLYDPRRKTLFQRECTHPKKEKQKLFKGSRMNFRLSKK